MSYVTTGLSNKIQWIQILMLVHRIHNIIYDVLLYSSPIKEVYNLYITIYIYIYQLCQLVKNNFNDQGFPIGQMVLSLECMYWIKTTQPF